MATDRPIKVGDYIWVERGPSPHVARVVGLTPSGLPRDVGGIIRRYRLASEADHRQQTDTRRAAAALRALALLAAHADRSHFGDHASVATSTAAAVEAARAFLARVDSPPIAKGGE